MVLAHEIGPHLPFLKRFARARVGHDLGKEAVQTLVSWALTDSGTAEIESVVAGLGDAGLRLALYKQLHRLLLEYEGAGREPAFASEAERIAHRRLQPMDVQARNALLLTAMEGFTESDASAILDLPEKSVSRLVQQALKQMEESIKADVLIIEDEPLIAMDLETIVRDLGHRVVAVASTRREAVSCARSTHPSLVLADIQLADDSSGIDAVKDILDFARVPVIFITAFPERLLTGERPEPTFLISKPFQRSTVKTAITQALFFDTATLPPQEEVQAPPRPQPTDALPAPLPADQVSPRLGPVNASVVRGQLRLVDDTPAATATPVASVDAVRRLHSGTAKRLCAGSVGSNMGPGFTFRLETVRRLLSRRLTEERSLQLAIETKGLEGLLPVIAERLDEATVGDLRIFVDDLLDLVRQFPAYRAFIDEALAFDPIADESRAAARTAAAILEQQPDAIIDAPLKEAISEVRLVAEEQPDKVASLALFRSIGNTARAVGRSINKHLAAVRRKAGDTFDDTAGKGLGIALATLFVGGPLAAALMVLQRAFPAEFGFIGQLIQAGRALLGL